jgi:cell pole-organizing protein PopZ
MAGIDRAPEPTMDEILSTMRRSFDDADSPPQHSTAKPNTADGVGDFPPDMAESAPRGTLSDQTTLALQEAMATFLSLELPPSSEPSQDKQIEASPSATQLSPDGGEFRLKQSGSGTGEEAQSKGGAGSPHGLEAYGVSAQAAGNLLEGSVKDVLRPLLRQWLDENMTRVVSATLREELKSIKPQTTSATLPAKS